MVAGTHLSITLYVHSPSGSNLFLQLKEINRLPDAVRKLTSYGKCEFFELLRDVFIQQCYHPWILVYDLRADLVTHKMGVSWTRCWRTSYITSWSTDSRYPCTVLQCLFEQYPSRRVLSLPINFVYIFTVTC